MPDSNHIGSVAERTAQLAIELRVRDLAASIAFYRAAGLEVVRETQGFAAMRIADRYLLLAQTRGAASGPTPPNLRIVVADVDAALAQATARGWEIKYPLKDRGYGLRDFTVSDPDGLEVRFAALA